MRGWPSRSTGTAPAWPITPEPQDTAMNATNSIIAQADPGAGYRAQQAEIDAAVARALASGWYILGKEGEAFEQEFAAWLGTTRGVGAANRTRAPAGSARGGW